MNKGELIDKVAESASVSKKEADAVITAIVESIMEAVASGEKVTLVGFGTFEPRARAEREGRNPKTGEAMQIPATTTPAFSAGKLFKEKVAPKKPELETAGSGKAKGGKKK
ncbi:HU family DNA-binding protein [Pseudanabaena sp. FACHB-2040]|uniref:HU family DNA-binding protein n=1 Tax=Pseudanabaena sp. FACHB-2040 TaxID=2692859 RepID=UPI00168769A0|nr:HU family DNA-binding protein [Pseudanabaena sp. FACHB-2040]MBD2259338.1 HU family DNA-binding protein [Pseudanabaena sp. FACHB-2040]